MRSTLLTAALLGGGLLAAGHASAFGGMGGHGGGGFGGGGMHMGGGFGSGMHAGGFHAGASNPAMTATPSLQTGRSVAGPNLNDSARISRAPGANGGAYSPDHHHHHGWYGGGFGSPYYGGDYGYYDGSDVDQYAGDDSQPVQEGRSEAEGSAVCSTPVKTCRLGTTVDVGTPCWCNVPGGRSGGHVTN